MIRRTAMRPYWPMYFRTWSRVLARTGPRAASLLASKIPSLRLLSRTGGGPIGPPPVYRISATSGSALGLHRLVELQLTGVDGVDAVVGDRRVAVFVDVVGAEHRLTTLRGEQPVDHLLTIRAVRSQLLAGVEDQ